MAEDVILSVKNISKSFGNLQVLKEISSRGLTFLPI